uniref:Uncharacterized protein n=1 Tax=Anopheles maculatus TaxID=74869 RepID=A0A182SRW0_9DIPT
MKKGFSYCLPISADLRCIGSCPTLIGPLKGYYLFHHNHVRKRSLDRSEVRWVQQQHEKPRYKRDYSTFDQDFVRFPGFRSLVSGARMAYRDTSTHNIFPDPLFKEQWYLQTFLSPLQAEVEK